MSAPNPRHRHGAGPLPLDEETQRVRDLLRDAFDAVEDIDIRVRRVRDAWEVGRNAPSRLPTHEDVGRLFLFAAEVRSYADSLREIAETMVGSQPAYGSIVALDIVAEEVHRAKKGRSDAA